MRINLPVCRPSCERLTTAVSCQRRPHHATPRHAIALNRAFVPSFYADSAAVRPAFIFLLNPVGRARDASRSLRRLAASLASCPVASRTVYRRRLERVLVTAGRPFCSVPISCVYSPYVYLSPTTRCAEIGATTPRGHGRLNRSYFYRYGNYNISPTVRAVSGGV